MRIAVDAIPAVDRHKTGIGWYTHHLINTLPVVDTETDYTAWYLHARDPFNKDRYFADVPNLREKGIPFPARLWQRLSNRTGMPRVEWTTRFDVFFAPNYIPPTTSPFVRVAGGM